MYMRPWFLEHGRYITSELSYSYLTTSARLDGMLLYIPGSNTGPGSANVELMNKGQRANLQTPGKIIHRIPHSIINFNA